jgi:hypothetical protein
MFFKLLKGWVLVHVVTSRKKALFGQAQSQTTAWIETAKNVITNMEFLE